MLKNEHLAKASRETVYRHFDIVELLDRIDVAEQDPGRWQAAWLAYQLPVSTRILIRALVITHGWKAAHDFLAEYGAGLWPGSAAIDEDFLGAVAFYL